MVAKLIRVKFRDYSHGMPSEWFILQSFRGGIVREKAIQNSIHGLRFDKIDIHKLVTSYRQCICVRVPYPIPQCVL